MEIYSVNLVFTGSRTYETKYVTKFTFREGEESNVNEVEKNLMWKIGEIVVDTCKILKEVLEEKTSYFNNVRVVIKNRYHYDKDEITISIDDDVIEEILSQYSHYILRGKWIVVVYYKRKVSVEDIKKKVEEILGRIFAEVM